jgi:ribosomal protein S18 acetylase RimI-like enzyme
MSNRTRWLTAKDYPSVIKIEDLSFPEDQRWDEKAFRDYNQVAKQIGMVVDTEDDGVVAYVLYHFGKKHITIDRFATHPEFRRKRFMQMLFNRLKTKTSLQTRTKIQVEIPEDLEYLTDLFKECDFHLMNKYNYKTGNQKRVMFFEYSLNKQVWFGTRERIKALRNA